MTQNAANFFKDIHSKPEILEEYKELIGREGTGIGEVLEYARSQGHELCANDFVIEDDDLSDVSGGSNTNSGNPTPNFDFNFLPNVKYWIAFGNFQPGDTLDLNKE